MLKEYRTCAVSASLSVKQKRDRQTETSEMFQFGLFLKLLYK